jgi:hypothetical protein
MKFEIFLAGKWVPFANAIVVYLAANRYEATVSGLPYATPKERFDGAQVRIDGRPSVQVVGRQKLRAAGAVTTTLILDVLV